MVTRQPAGSVTLVFTDIEGSTRLLEELGTDGYREVLAAHREVVRDACGRFSGYEVDYEGDAFFYAFQSAADAVRAVSVFMAGLDGGPIRVRVGVHTGTPGLDPPKYVGLDVHRAARVMAAAHGGQVVLTRDTVRLLLDGVEVKDLGEHRFKDLGAPERCYQLLIAGLQDEFPRLKSLYHVTLPVPATPFVGRETEVRDVVRHLTHPDTRLLTLTGPGGTGKTRLALQAAADVSERYPDGVTWTALAPLRDPALVIPSIAQALDIREQPGQELTTTIAERLLGKKPLLLIDNAEHLLPQLANDLADLLHLCPTLTLLVTSRDRLRLHHETSWPVPALTDPDAVALFTSRAAAAGVHLHADSTLIELCHTLDNLPLAIELAAARTVLFAPSELLHQLTERLDYAAADADADRRHHTLRATIDWSYQLLTADQQRVYRALSVFAGGCTLDAARAVTNTDLDTLQALLDKSLVRRHITNAAGRYLMLETIREHATEHLEEGSDAAVIISRHGEWLVHEVERLSGPARNHDVAAMKRLESEWPNVRVALQRAIDDGDAHRAQRVLAALWHNWLSLGAAEEGDEWGTRIVSMPSPATPERGMALWHAAQFPRYRGDPGRAVELLRQAVAVLDRTGPRRALAAAHADLATALADVGAIDEAEAHAVKAIAVREEIGDDARIGHALEALAWVKMRKGDFRHALELNEQAVACWERAGGRLETAETLAAVGHTARRTGDMDRARQAIAESFARAREGGDDPTISLAVATLGLVCVDEGATDIGLTLVAWSTRRAASLGTRHWGIEEDIAATATVGSGVQRARAAAAAAGLTAEDALALGLGARGRLRTPTTE